MKRNRVDEFISQCLPDMTLPDLRANRDYLGSLISRKGIRKISSIVGPLKRREMIQIYSAIVKQEHELARELTELEKLEPCKETNNTYTT